MQKNKELKDLHYGNYNPYNSTLELTRSSSGAIGALVCLKSLGIKGFQEIYINMFEGTYRIRELLSKEEGVCVLNNRSNGLVTFFIIKPARYKNLSIEEIIKLPLAEIEFIKKYNVDFSKFILNRAKNNLINFTFTSSRSYKYNGTNISLGALKIYPISVFFDKFLFPDDIKCIFCGKDIPSFYEKPYCENCEKHINFKYNINGNYNEVCTLSKLSFFNKYI